MNITLKELAYFNRTFFPQDLENGLKKHTDMSEGEIWTYVEFFKKNYKGGIVHLYQEYISNEELTEKLELIFQEHLSYLRIKV